MSEETKAEREAEKAEKEQREGLRDQAEDRAEEHVAASEQARGDRAAARKRAREDADKEDRELLKHSYVALHAMVRNGEAVRPGDKVRFEAHEAQHVRDLLEARAIAHPKYADEMLDQADEAREVAQAKLSGGGVPVGGQY